MLRELLEEAYKNFELANKLNNEFLIIQEMTKITVYKQLIEMCNDNKTICGKEANDTAKDVPVY